MSDFLVTGAGGQLGSVLMRALAEARIDAMGCVSQHGPQPQVGKVFAVDLCDPRSYQERLFSLSPKVIVHLAGVTQIADAYADPERAYIVNVEATTQLLQLASALGARFIYASTDLVFDGETAPYDEDAATEPLSCYGRSKLTAECHVLTYRRGLVVRFPLLYGLPEVTRAPTFFQNVVAALRSGQRVPQFTDEVRTPLWLDDAAQVCIALGRSELTGVLHAGGPERLSRLQMGERIAQALSVDPALLQPISRLQVPAPEPRPRDTSLNSARYLAALGRAPGRPMHEALPVIFSRSGSPFLS